jgi:virulence-associated protein VagC
MTPGWGLFICVVLLGPSRKDSAVYPLKKEAWVKMINNTLVLTPVDDPWQFFKDSLEGFSDDFFKDGRNQPDAQERKAAFT